MTDDNAGSGEDAQSSLFDAVSSSTPEKVKLLIEEVAFLLDKVRQRSVCEAVVNCQGAFGATPLMLAARNSEYPEVVTLLIEAGADVNAKDDDGMTPLMFAARKSVYREVVTLC